MNDHTRRFTAERWDHDRDERKHLPRPTDLAPSQISALAALIVSVEVLCESGVLDTSTEMLMRVRVAETLSAFGMSAGNRDEREAAHAQA